MARPILSGRRCRHRPAAMASLQQRLGGGPVGAVQREGPALAPAGLGDRGRGGRRACRDRCRAGSPPRRGGAAPDRRCRRIRHGPRRGRSPRRGRRPRSHGRSAPAEPQDRDPRRDRLGVGQAVADQQRAGPGRQRLGRRQFVGGGARRRSAPARASAKRSTTLRAAHRPGQAEQGRRARRPCTSRSAVARPSTRARSSFETLARSEAKAMEGERSIQIHTVWAASHSRSRT